MELPEICTATAMQPAAVFMHLMAGRHIVQMRRTEGVQVCTHVHSSKFVQQSRSTGGKSRIRLEYEET